MAPFPVGVADVTYRSRGDDAGARSAAARVDGFDHYDPAATVDPGTLALPVGCPVAFPRPQPGWCATPAPPAGPGAWERAVRWWRAAPGALLEPWAGSAVASSDAVRAFLAEVPGTRLLVDTGHVADWGGDPCELLPLADHVQLRQGAPGHAQLHVDAEAGVVDFVAVVDVLARSGYTGRLTVEHFDLPDQGWPCPDPVAWALDVRALLRPGPEDRNPPT